MVREIFARVDHNDQRVIAFIAFIARAGMATWPTEVKNFLPDVPDEYFRLPGPQDAEILPRSMKYNPLSFSCTASLIWSKALVLSMVLS